MAHNVNEIIANIAQFEIPGWTNVTPDQIEVAPIGDGFINTTLQVEKVSGSSDDDSGPTKILYKTYGGNIMEKQVKEIGYKVNSPLIQSLIFYEMSKRGWGPKLYGLFDGGRVEELVDCRTLTGMEAFDPEISKDLAIAYARFHSLQLPIDHEYYDLMTKLLPSQYEGKKQLAAFIESKNITEDHPFMCFKRLYDFPFQGEANWVQSIRSKIQQRIVLATMDPNYLNRLVKNQKPSDPNATRTLIIDFDLTSYSHRGYDLGGHFVLRMLGQNLQLSGMPYPNEAERKFFLSSYLEEAEKLFDDFDASSLDSLDNLMLECDLNALAYLVANFVSFLKLYTVLDERPTIVQFVDPLMTLYQELKEQFFTRYPDLVSN